jgi:hypothetical protein
MKFEFFMSRIRYSWIFQETMYFTSQFLFFFAKNWFTKFQKIKINKLYIYIYIYNVKDDKNIYSKM